MTRSRVHGFTPSLTRFVGRAGAADDVARLLGECRLVTVTGRLLVLKISPIIAMGRAVT
jgi:hypothetical protein